MKTDKKAFSKLGTYGESKVYEVFNDIKTILHDELKEAKLVTLELEFDRKYFSDEKLLNEQCEFADWIHSNDGEFVYTNSYKDNFDNNCNYQIYLTM